MTVTAGGIRVRILGDDSDLQGKLRSSTTAVAKWGAAAAAAAGAATAALVRSGLQSADAQAKLARQLGATTEGLGALERAAGRAGVSQNALQRASERLNQRLGEAVNTTGRARETLDELGLSAERLSEMDIDERMAALSDAMRGAGLSSQEMAFHLRNLGIRQSEMVNLMMEGGEAIRDSRRRIEQYGIALSDVDAAKVEAANDAMAEGAVVTKGMTQQLAVQFAPVLEGISDRLADAAAEVGGLGKVAERAFDSIVTGVGFAADAVHGFRAVLKGVEVLFRGVSAAAWGSVSQIAEGYAWLANFIPGIDIDFDQTFLGRTAQAAMDSLREARGELHELAMQEMPSSRISRWVDEVKEGADEAARAAVSARERMGGALDVPGMDGPQSEQEAKHREQIAERLERIREANMEEIELLNARFERENEIIREGLESQLLTEAEYEQLIRDQKARHEQEITDIEERAAAERNRIAEMEARQKEQILSGAMQSLTTLMNSESRKLFEIGKASAIAQSIVATYQGMSEALKLGWPMGPIAASAIGAAGFGNVAAIKSQSFGGGGAGAVATGSNTAAVNAASQPTGQSAPAGGGQSTIINLQGDSFGRKQVRELIEQINEDHRDGGRIVVT